MYMTSVIVKTNTLKADQYYKNTLVLKYEINYPQFESSIFTKSISIINQYYYVEAQRYKQYCETTLFKSAADDYNNSVANGFPVRAYESVVNFTVTFNQDCALSLYFDKYEFTGGAHGNTVRYSDTWDLQSGRRILLRELISTDYQSIYNIIEQEANQRIKAGEGMFFEDLRKNITDNFNPENYFINPSGVVIYYQLYTISPYVSGIQEFLIPYSNKVKKPECRMR